MHTLELQQQARKRADMLYWCEVSNKQDNEGTRTDRGFILHVFEAIEVREGFDGSPLAMNLYLAPMSEDSAPVDARGSDCFGSMQLDRLRQVATPFA